MIKSKILKFLLIGIILVMGSSSSVSGFANSNSDNDLSSFNDSSEIAQNALGDVLVLYEDTLANVEYAISGISNYALTLWALGSSNTPNLTDLTPYPAIILTSNYAYSDSNGVGNVLADYVDAGGRVIQLSHSFSSGYSILGRFNSSSYMPFWGTIGSTSRTYDNLSTHPIFEGVTSFSTIHSFNAVPTSGAQVIASYSDGEPLMAIKGSVVAMNAYVGLSVGGDLGLILENSIKFLIPEDAQDTIPPTITGPVELLVELGDPSAQVQWLIEDDSAGSFIIYLNGSFFSSGSWTDLLHQAGIGLSSYTPGTYEFQVNTTDIHGNEATFTTIVYVRDTVAPVIGSALDRYSYVVGSTLNILFWQPSDIDPDTYFIFRTDSLGAETMVESAMWPDSVQVALNIDGLDVGEYVYRAEFSDGSGNVGVAETIVIVEPEVVSSEPTGNTSDEPTTSLPPTTTSEPPVTTTEDPISTSESDDTTPELPIPFSNIYLIIFSILGLTMISRKKKHNS